MAFVESETVPESEQAQLELAPSPEAVEPAENSEPPAPAEAESREN